MTSLSKHSTKNSMTFIAVMRTVTVPAPMELIPEYVKTKRDHADQISATRCLRYLLGYVGVSYYQEQCGIGEQTAGLSLAQPIFAARHGQKKGEDGEREKELHRRLPRTNRFRKESERQFSSCSKMRGRRCQQEPQCSLRRDQFIKTAYLQAHTR